MILELKKLKLGYAGEVVIKKADLTVDEGDFICVVGANGSGKSTLVKGILGLIKPLGGKVIYGEGLTQTMIGYLPQEMRLDNNFPATVTEIVLSGTLGRMKGRPFYAVAEHQAATAALRKLKIQHLADKSFRELSGGQKQKVLLARSLAATSKLLILDEPSNNLDPAARKDFYKILRQLNGEGLTIIMITHDLDIEDLIGNKIVATSNGELKVSTTAAYLRRLR